LEISIEREYLDIDWKYLFEKNAFCLPCIHGFGAMISMVAGYFS
jgi:hypothetical protein